jgi:hypothetical protein
MIGVQVWADLGGTLAHRYRIYLCGRLVASVEGRRIEDAMPGRQGRLTFAYLVVNRGKAVERDELIDALWGERAPADPDTSLSAILSKLRRAIAPASLEGRSALTVALPDGAWIDVDAASEALHRAEGGGRPATFRRGLVSGARRPAHRGSGLSERSRRRVDRAPSRSR